jgi:hypothetical protein
MQEKELETINLGRMAEVSVQHCGGILRQFRENAIQNLVSMFNSSKSAQEMLPFIAEISVIDRLDGNLKKLIVNANKTREKIHGNK